MPVLSTLLLHFVIFKCIIYLETISRIQSWFFSQKKVGLKECRVGLDKGAPEIKTDVESRST